MRSKPGRTRCKPPVVKAFTLIELIVTVAVLCLIAGLQLAANPHGKGQSETAICSANLRRLGQAWLMYAADNNGSLPGNYDGGSGNTNQTWCVGWQDFSGHPDNTNVTRVMQSQLGTRQRYFSPAGLQPQWPLDRVYEPRQQSDFHA